MTVLAKVNALWVFPVKSLSGSQVAASEIRAGGLAGDRSWAVLGEDGTTLTAKTEPRLREAVASLVGAELRVEVPGAPAGLGEQAAAEALSAWLGRSVRLERRGDAGFADVAPVHLVSTASIDDAAHAEECDACDVAEPRANLVLDLLPGATSELEWLGRTIIAGASTLTVVKLPKHCLGAYADVVGTGVVSVGDEVRGS